MSNEEQAPRATPASIERKLGKRGTLALVGLLLIFLEGIVGLTEGQQERRGRKDSDNIEAYLSFMQGWEFSSRPAQETNTQARQMFEKATELDPKYAAAYAMLGWTHLLEWIWQWTQDPQALDQAFALEQKAVALDDSLPLAHMFLGTTYLFKNQFEHAIAEEERVIALSPDGADGYVALGQILTHRGKAEEAIGLVEKAMRLNPHYQPAYLSILGQAYYVMRRYEEAIATFKKLISRNPDHLAAHVHLACIYSETGRNEEVQLESTAILRISPNFSVEGMRQRLPYKDPVVVERYLAALRKAGLQ